MSPDEHAISAVVGYISLGMFEDAWQELESLPPEQRADGDVISLRIEILQRLEKWESCRVLAESMAKRFPANPDWWITWAYALRREKSIHEPWRARFHPGPPFEIDDSRPVWKNLPPYRAFSLVTRIG